MQTLCSSTTPVNRAEVVAWLPTDPAIVGHARSLTAAVLSGWGLSELVCTTQLIVSELVTNALLHAPLSGARFRLAVGNSTLRCIVSDDSRGIPRVVQARPDELHGRGLLLVSELADQWGVRTTDTGKAVWAVQRIPVRSGPSRSAGKCKSGAGAKGPSKLTGPVMEHLEALLAADPGMKARALAEAVAEEFGLTVHPRSVERALARRREGRDQEEDIRSGC